MRLLTIPMSHYCEKARWGLERLGCAYTEERHLQGFHYPRAYRLSGGPYVPVLVDGDVTVSDAQACLTYPARKYGGAEYAHIDAWHARCRALPGAITIDATPFQG